jgi:hypothetical protein
MSRSSLAVPLALTRRANKVLRPRDIDGTYAHPRAELARLARSGVVHHLATGYYTLIPQERLGDPRWRPELDAAALGLAQTDYGADSVALMGVSAARHHGAIPRAIAVAVVAVPKQRPPLNIHAGRLIFVKRDVNQLDVEHAHTQLASGWVTTIEQTLLDLSARPDLGGLSGQDSAEAIRALGARADWAIVDRLAAGQHKPAALRAALTITERESAQRRSVHQ